MGNTDCPTGFVYHRCGSQFGGFQGCCESGTEPCNPDGGCPEDKRSDPIEYPATATSTSTRFLTTVAVNNNPAKTASKTTIGLTTDGFKPTKISPIATTFVALPSTTRNTVSVTDAANPTALVDTSNCILGKCAPKNVPLKLIAETCGPAAVVIALILIFCCIRKKNQRKARKEDERQATIIRRRSDNDAAADRERQMERENARIAAIAQAKVEEEKRVAKESEEAEKRANAKKEESHEMHEVPAYTSPLPNHHHFVSSRVYSQSYAPVPRHDPSPAATVQELPLYNMTYSYPSSPPIPQPYQAVPPHNPSRHSNHGEKWLNW